MPDFSNIKNSLISVLGAPCFETDTCILFCGDTLDIQKRITLDIFDAIITSPPYNIGKEYEKVKPLNDYIDWSVEWISD